MKMEFNDGFLYVWQGFAMTLLSGTAGDVSPIFYEDESTY